MAAEQGKTKASEEELESLKAHFETMGLRGYTDLNGDCKMHIMELLDTKTLIQLGMCSKNEQQTVADTPLKIFSISIHSGDHTKDGRSWPMEKLYVTFDDEYNDNEARINFMQFENRVLVMDWRYRVIWEHENAEYFKKSVEFFEDLLKKCRYRVEIIHLNMGPEANEWATREDSTVKRLPYLKGIHLSEMTSNQSKVWLQKVPNGLEWLSLEVDVTAEFLEMSPVRTTSRLDTRRCDITDAQLLEFQIPKIQADSAPNLTVHGINTVFKRWRRGEGFEHFEGFYFHRIGHRPDNEEFPVEDVVEGLAAWQCGERFYGKIQFYVKHNELPNKEMRLESGEYDIEAHVPI